MLKDDQVRILSLARLRERCFVHGFGFYEKRALIPNGHLGVMVSS